MSQKLSFLRSALNYSIGVFGSKVVLFILVPIYSFFLSKEELGEYDLLLISITLLTPLITIQLADAVYRHLLQELEKAQRAVIVSTALKLILLGYIIFFLISQVLNFFIDYRYFATFHLLQFSSCLYILFQQVIRGIGKNRLYAFMGISNAFLAIIFSAIFLLYFKLRVNGILIALFFAQVITVSLTLFLGKIYYYIRFNLYDKVIAKKMIRYSWPLLPNAISWWLIDLGNRYIILFFLSEEYNGIYAISARYAGIIALFNSIFILAWQDYAISDKLDKNYSERTSQIFNYFIIFELSTVVVLTASSKYLIQWTTDVKFHEASYYLPILLLSAGVSAFCAYYGALYLKKKDTLGVFSTTFIGGIVNISISVIFIEKFGLYAVALGSLFGFLVTLVLRIKSFDIRINIKPVFVCLIIYMLVLSIQYYDYHYLSIASVIFSVIIFLALNRRLILLVKSKLVK